MHGARDRDVAVPDIAEARNGRRGEVLDAGLDPSSLQVAGYRAVPNVRVPTFGAG